MKAKQLLSAFALGVCVGVGATCHAVTHVDILVAYDTTASQWIDGTEFTKQSFAEVQIERANEVLKNSGLGNVFDFRLTGIHNGTFSYKTMATTLAEASDSTDSSWIALRSDRDKTGADIVVVLVDAGVTSGQVGNSNGLEPFVAQEGETLERKYGLDFPQVKQWLQWFAERTYSIVDVSAARDGYTFVHEVGHVMGAGHPDNISHKSGPQLYNYSSGVMMQGSDGNYYATVMGYNYNVTGASEIVSYKVLPYFSSPSVVNPATGDVLGDATHDNVKTLRNSCGIVAGFRAEVLPPTDGDSSEGDRSGDDGASIIEPVVAESAKFKAKKTVFTAALMDGSAVVGIAEFIVAATRNGISKVSGMIIGLDGKKKKIANVKSEVYDAGDNVARVSLKNVTINGMDGTLNVTLGSDESIIKGNIGSFALCSASRGIDTSTARFYIATPIVSIMGGEVVQSVESKGQMYSVLPYAATPEVVAVGAKWTVANGGKVVLKKNRATGVSELVLKGLGNFSALKLNYQAKTATFKGSFTVYAVLSGKFTKFKFDVTGVVLDGRGIGIAVCKKVGLSVAVFIE